MNKLEIITNLIKKNTSLNSGCAENLANEILNELEIVQRERLNEETANKDICLICGYWPCRC